MAREHVQPSIAPFVLALFTLTLASTSCVATAPYFDCQRPGADCTGENATCWRQRCVVPSTQCDSHLQYDPVANPDLGSECVILGPDAGSPDAGDVDAPVSESGDAGTTICGDGHLDPSEACDGPFLRHATCWTEGFLGGGEIGCTSLCALDVSNCVDDPSMPLPIAPVTNTYDLSRQPEFSWLPSTTTVPGATIEYQLDISTDLTFTTNITHVETAATRARPSNGLSVNVVPPVGRVYWWRVRACVQAGLKCSGYTQPRRLHVGRARNDFNGDGFSDVVVASPDGPSFRGSAYVYLGSAAGLSTTPVVQLDSPVGGGQFASVLATGDLNADGFADLVVGIPGLGDSTDFQQPGRVNIYFGQPGSALPAHANRVIRGSSPGEGFGHALAVVGDMNGDGIDDLVVGTQPWAATYPPFDRAYVYFGAPDDELDTIADAQLRSPTEGDNSTDFASALAGAGDVNGDGFEDLAIALPSYSSNSTDGHALGRVFVYLGQSGPLDLEPDGIIEGSDPKQATGTTLTPIGDFDGDGLSDLLVGSNDITRHLYRGSRGKRFDTFPDAEMPNGITSAGADLNGDGLSDVVITEQGLPSRLFIYYGQPTEHLGDLPRQEFQSPDWGNWTSAYTLGDVNSDGYDDLAIGLPQADEWAGEMWFYEGEVGSFFESLAQPPMLRIFGPDPPNGYFGAVIR